MTYGTKTLLVLGVLGGCSSPGAERAPAASVPVPVFGPGSAGAGSGAPAPTPAADALAPITMVDPTGALAPFYQALAASEKASPGSGAGRVLIDEFGDSHTAGDRLTGHLRTVLQQRFGDAGRGFVLPGRPRIKWYELTDVTYGTEGDWKADQGGHHDTKEPYGLAGVRSYASSNSAQVWVQTCADCDNGKSVASFEIFFLRQKDGGVLEAQVDDGAWQRIHTALGKDQGDVPLPDYVTLPVTDGEHKLTLRPRGGKEVDVFGIAMERPAPGVIVDALGIVGLQMSHLWSWDWTVIGPQLAHRDPSLVILQYGTNEVDDPDLDLQRFEDRYVELLGRVKQSVPNAAILVLGPPDLGKRDLSKKECERMAKDAEKKARRTRRTKVSDIPDPTLEPVVPDGCTWKTPQKLLDVIAAEGRAAQRAGVAFFDTFTAMGGANVIEGMVDADPPLAYGDHVHFTAKGYAIWGDLLLEDLMRGYTTWEKRTASGR